jgi:hypothetical protein
MKRGAQTKLAKVMGAALCRAEYYIVMSDGSVFFPSRGEV